MLETRYNDMPLPQDLKDLLSSCRSVLVPRDRSAILQLAMGDGKQPVVEGAYDIPGRGPRAGVRGCVRHTGARPHRRGYCNAMHEWIVRKLPRPAHAAPRSALH